VTSRRPARGSPAARARQSRGRAGAAPERLEVTLDGLRQLRDRIRKLQLEPGDWPVMDALVSNQIVRTEESNERRIAKVAGVPSAHVHDCGTGAGYRGPGESRAACRQSSGGCPLPGNGRHKATDKSGAREWARRRGHPTAHACRG
jgi:hypothetical protein